MIFYQEMVKTINDTGGLVKLSMTMTMKIKVKSFATKGIIQVLQD